MQMITVLRNNYECISNPIHNLLKDNQLSIMADKLREQLVLKNGDLDVILSTIQSMIRWMDSAPISTRNEKFIYEQLCRMSDTIQKGNSISPVKIKSPEIKKDKKILISHSSKDKKYCDAFLQLFRRIGIDDEKIVYTSNSSTGIPLGRKIFQYLKEQFDDELYVLYVFSDDYFDSPATLNEMGAAWVTSSQYSAVAVPGFNYDNKKFLNCAVEHDEFVGQITDPVRINQLKNELTEFFDIDLSENKWVDILAEYLNAVKE